jgi:ABC-type uncharacterized transport system involved in gliding motility auxiliary subunit
MNEFSYLSKRISFERVDPQQKIEVARQYAVRTIPDTVVAAGERIERPQSLDEQALVNAILKVSRERMKRICFTEGHGERPLTDAIGQSISIIDKVLENENYERKSVNLTASAQVPAECDVLVSAGPRKPFLEQETASVADYLSKGGKALFLVDAVADPESDPQLDGLLKPWNITLGKDTVIDNSAARMAGSGIGVPIVQNYPDHPITKDMKGIFTVFPLPRSVKASDRGSGEVFSTELLRTSSDSWAETEFKMGQEPQLDPAKDTKGPVSIGVAVTKKVGEKETRLVVIGNSDFATNSYIRTAGNGNLVFNTINWLAQDEELISIRPKPVTSRTVTMNEGQQNLFFWIVVLVMPVAVVGAGAYIWWKRR